MPTDQCRPLGADLCRSNLPAAATNPGVAIVVLAQLLAFGYIEDV